MNFWNEILGNRVLVCAVMGWTVAQVLKTIIDFCLNRSFNPERLFGSGGMPSSHTSMVVAASIMLGALNGFDSAVFAAAVVFSSVVMYDATGVRRETGRQAVVINRILQDVLINGRPISNVELKELVGHKPIEVAAGALLGVAIAVVYLLILF